ncbi:hypothetical protein [Aurantibacillus circumpalustris]|uniref:hypothetical protein n=1 Tax=Aurantibacillus circumpalustris TaxID=3036359 RepID=UPI00295B588B|nr:hypothetical protein [Aurantibacillus circumpalustris]
MKLHFVKVCFTCFLFIVGYTLAAQKSKTIAENFDKNPATFTISKTDYNNLFSKQSNETITGVQNKYLTNSTVLMNSLNGDMKFMKIKLDYFKNSFLMIQVNGGYSTQIFILSDDKSVFYKGSIDNGVVTMTKCNEDDIVSE